MATRIKTGALQGIDGLAVSVDVDICRGLPGFFLVGLPNTAVRESRERVLAALRNSGVSAPPGKITVNLAPAGIRKEGASYDLAIAIGVVAAEEKARGKPWPKHRSQALFLGELSLFGELRKVRGLLAQVLAAEQRGEKLIVVPAQQAWEAKLVKGMHVIGARSLVEVVNWWHTGKVPEPWTGAEASLRSSEALKSTDMWQMLGQLDGQSLARKAAVIAAVGRHNLLLVGPPGTGKTRLAKILGGLQSKLNYQQGLEATRIHSVAGTLKRIGILEQRPFRAPHHTITRAGLIGGGAALRPGEITLAHHGLLFLDELTEFSPAVLDVLREPMEDRKITIARGPGSRTYPADFQLVAAMNPCRCGYLGSTIRQCRCSSGEQSRYMGRLSGPLLDRFDLFVEMGSWQGAFLNTEPDRSDSQQNISQHSWRISPSSEAIENARCLLAGLTANRTTKIADRLDPKAAEYLERLRKSLGLSLRAIDRCVKVGLTIAALDGRQSVSIANLQEVLEFRSENLALNPE